VSWRDHVFSATKNNTSTTASSSTANNNNNSKLLAQETLARHQLDPTTVCRKVDEYMNTIGLVEAHPMHYNIILHAMTKVGNPQTTPFVGDEIYNKMMARAQSKDMYNSLDNDNKSCCFHPTAATVYGIVELWAQSGLVEAPARAEAYLVSLQKWYQQTKRLESFTNSQYLLCYY
jgi:hypothetical protein